MTTTEVCSSPSIDARPASSATPPINNPFAAQVNQCNSSALLNKAYEVHRLNRNADKLRQLTQNPTVSPDAILRGLVIDNEPPEFDPRNCITIWARPTSPVMDMVQEIQRQLIQVIDPENLTPEGTKGNTPVKTNKGPLWLMPRDCLHMSALEISHSAPKETTQALLVSLRPHISQILHPPPQAPTLIKPQICFDSSALALTFLPDPTQDFTYTHYRANLFDMVSMTGVPVESRYQVPSAHVTLARFIDDVPPKQVKQLLAKITELNEQLASSDLEWTICSERASEFRCGRIWYGGGWCEGHALTVEEAMY